MKKQSFLLSAILAGAAVMTSCSSNAKKDVASTSAVEMTADSTSVYDEEATEEEDVIFYDVDSVLTRAARFYAGISREGVVMEDSLAEVWDTYSDQIASLLKRSESTLYKMDSLIATDMDDLRQAADYVLYPLSGADYLYPVRMFPEADTYFLIGLEKPGSVMDSIKVHSQQYATYRQALTTYLQSSFFVTKQMKEDLSNEEIDGTLPIITLLMAVDSCEIISVDYRQMDEEGNIVESEHGRTHLAEVKFARMGCDRVQTLYYLSTNLKTRFFDKKLQRYFETELPQHNVVSFLKAASYALYEPQYSQIRSDILDFSMAIIEDDSGIPYRYFKGWDVTLYGSYQQPLKLFPDSCYQLDLKEAYEQEGVRELPFRIGYNHKSNWLCARKL